MYYIILSVAVLVMLYVMITYVRIKKMPEGTPMMIKLAGIIRGGNLMCPAVSGCHRHASQAAR